VAIREFHQVGVAGEITRAGNFGDEVISGLHPVTGVGKFLAQMIRPLGPGPLRMKRTPDVWTKEINSSVGAKDEHPLRAPYPLA